MPNSLFDSKVIHGKYKDIKETAESKGEIIYRLIPADENIDRDEMVMIFNNKKSYKKIKISLSMLVKVMWELGSCYDRILALLLYNMNSKTNIVPFDKRYMMSNKEKFGLKGFSDRTFIRAFGMLEESKMFKFGVGRIMVSPGVLFTGSSNNEKQMQMIYDSFDKEQVTEQKVSIKTIPDEISPIKMYFDKKGEKMDCNWRSLGIHNMCMRTRNYSNKKVRGFLYLLYYALSDDCKIEDNIKTIAKRSGMTAETLSITIKLLMRYNIIKLDVSDTILFNPDYISRSNSSIRDLNRSAYSRAEKLTFEEIFSRYELIEIRSPKDQKSF